MNRSRGGGELYTGDNRIPLLCQKSRTKEYSSTMYLPCRFGLMIVQAGDKELRAKESQTTPSYTTRSILLYIYKLSRVENERSGYWFSGFDHVPGTHQTGVDTSLHYYFYSQASDERYMRQWRGELYCRGEGQADQSTRALAIYGGLSFHRHGDRRVIHCRYY